MKKPECLLLDFFFFVVHFEHFLFFDVEMEINVSNFPKKIEKSCYGTPQPSTKTNKTSSTFREEKNCKNLKIELKNRKKKFMVLLKIKLTLRHVPL